MKALKTARLSKYSLRDDLGQTKDVADKDLERVRTMGDRPSKLYREVIAEGPP